MDSNGVTWTKEDIEIVEKFIKIKNSGYYCSGEEVTRVYNRILHKNVNSTSCGSCLRGRIQELEVALNHFKELCKKQEEKAQALKNVEVNSSPSDENKATVEPENKPNQKKVGRPKKVSNASEIK